MAFSSGIDRFSLMQLRASLSLVLSPGDVDAVSTGLPDVIDVDEHQAKLSQTIRSAQLRLLKYRLQRLVQFRKPVAENRDDTCAAQLRGSQTSATLLLTLHIGTLLSTRQLAELLDRPEPEITIELSNARLALLEGSQETCREWEDRLGRYRDGNHDLLIAATVAGHRSDCRKCRETLEAFERLDEALGHEIQLLATNEVARSKRRHSLGRRLVSLAPLALIAGIIAAVMVTAGMAGNLISSGPSPLYASKPSAARGEQGWIIYGTWDGGLHAFDPVRGDREILHPEYYTAHIQDGANYLVSPQGERVAIFAQADVAGLHWATRRVRIVEITGADINEIEWSNAAESGWPTGWLGEEELLISSIPVYEGGEPTEQFLERLEAEGHLRAVNVETGQQRVVFRGAVAQVIPSPDGSRLAIVRPRDPAYPGTTVELWSVVDGVADEILGKVEHRFTWSAGMLWDPSSEALLIGNIAEAEDQRSENSRDDAFRGHVTSTHLLRLDRDGSIEHVTDPRSGIGTQIIGVDEERIVYAEFSLPGNQGEQEIFVHDRASGEQYSIKLPKDEFRFRPTPTGTLGYQNGFISHPDKDRFMLHLGARHYLRVDPAQHYGDSPDAIYLMIVDEHFESGVATVISDRWPVTPLGWSPSDAIQPYEPPEIDHASEFDRPKPVGEIRDYAQLGNDSITSPDGAALPMVEALDDRERPYLWFPLVETGRWIASQTSDLSWNASSHAFFGVTRLGGENGGMSRITQHSASQRGGSSVDGFFDPLSLEEQHETYYAAPAASPHATRTSFFTVDTSEGRITLWLADWLGGTTKVHSFAYHHDSNREINPFSVWLDDHSLIFAEPLEWSRDVPTRVALQRLSIRANGDYDVDTVFELTPPGRDRGVDLVELALQDGGDYVAWRLRHYADIGDTTSGTDSIRIASTADLSDTIEVDRADAATGLNWAPGGQAISFASGQRVAVYSLDSHNIAYVSGELENAAHPAWLSDQELWFNAGENGDAEVYRVRFGD